MTGDLDERPGTRVRAGLGRVWPAPGGAARLWSWLVSWLGCHRRAVARWVAVTLGVGLLVRFGAHGGVPALIHLIRGTATPPDSGAPLAGWAGLLRDTSLWAVLAAAGVGCAVIADGTDGARAVGVRPRLAWRAHVATTWRALRGPFLVTSLADWVMVVPPLVWPGLARWYGGAPWDPLAGPGWFPVPWSLTNATAEECVVLGLAVWIAERLLRDRGRIAGGIAIAAVVSLRLSYHLYAGLGLVAMIPGAWLLTVLYRRTRALAAIIVAHAAFDLLIDLPLPAVIAWQATLALSWVIPWLLRWRHRQRRRAARARTRPADTAHGEVARGRAGDG